MMDYDFSQGSVAKNAELREHLAKMMHMELFPRLYTEGEKAALPANRPKEPKLLEASPEARKGEKA